MASKLFGKFASLFKPKRNKTRAPQTQNAPQPTVGHTVGQIALNTPTQPQRPRALASATRPQNTAPPPQPQPQTTAPQNTAPQPQPQTTAPQTTAPQPQPQTTAPQTNAPQPQPQTTAPQTTAPQPQPQTNAPQTTAPQTTAPQTTAPQPQGETQQIATLKQRIETTYGFSLDNARGVDAALASFRGKQTRQAVEAATKPKDWSLQELQYLDQALKAYGPLLGTARPEELGAQPLTSFSRAEMRVAKANDDSIQQRPSVSGVTFGGAGNVTMFDQAHDPYDFATGEQQFRGTIEHELSHALIEKLPAKINEADSTMIEKFWREMNFWTSINTLRYGRDNNDAPAAYGASGFSAAKTREAAKADGSEAPITDYGMLTAKEDLAEAMMFFFEDPATLKRKCPKRLQFILDNLGSKLDPAKVQAARDA